MLPAIYFVFSRRVREERPVAPRSGGPLTTQDEAAEIRERAESRAAWVDEDDLFSLGFTDFLESLTTGVRRTTRA